MSLWETSDNPGSQPVQLPSIDKYPAEDRPSDGASSSGTNKIDSTTGPYVTTKDGKIRLNNGTYDLIFIGVDGDGSAVMKIVKPNIDKNVLDATDAELIFNSSQNVFKVVAENDVSLTRNSGTRTVTTSIVHGLNYIPAILAFVNINNVYYPLPFYDINPNSGADDGKVRMAVTAKMTSTEVIFTVEAYGSYMTSASDTTPIKYFLLQETAS